VSHRLTVISSRQSHSCLPWAVPALTETVWMLCTASLAVKIDLQSYPDMMPGQGSEREVDISDGPWAYLIVHMLM